MFPMTCLRTAIYTAECVYLGTNTSRVKEAEVAGVKPVPALAMNGTAFHINLASALTPCNTRGWQLTARSTGKRVSRHAPFFADRRTPFSRMLHLTAAREPALHLISTGFDLPLLQHGNCVFSSGHIFGFFVCRSTSVLVQGFRI